MALMNDNQQHLIPNIPLGIKHNNGYVWCKSCDNWEPCIVTRDYASRLRLRFLRESNVGGELMYLYTDDESKLLALPYLPVVKEQHQKQRSTSKKTRKIKQPIVIIQRR